MSIMMENPFKLLESYTKEDKDIWGGRTTEIDHLYNLSFASNLILIYGMSGVGKTSLIQCGLANKFKRTDWHAVWITRGENINQNLINLLLREAGETPDPDKEVSLPDTIQNIYLKHFKPIFLVFDQLEELFIFGDNNEIQGFIDTIKEILSSDIQCKIILVLREEYHGHLKTLQDAGVAVFKASVKIEPMSIPDAVDSISKLLDKYNIRTPDADRRTCAEKIASDCAVDGRVDLANLQVYLFWAWEKAAENVEPDGEVAFTHSILREIGDGKNVLARYLNAIVERVSKGKAGGVWYLLQHFVSRSQTKQTVKLDDIQDIDPQTARNWLNGLRKSKLVKCSNETGCEIYSLVHDSLVPLIIQKKTAASRGRNRNPTVHGNPFKGLPSYEEKDATIFFGRSLILRELLAFFEDKRLLVIVGPSGSGKSSIIKAGIIPALKTEGYQVMQGEPGAHPMVFGREISKRMQDLNGGKFLLYIDQFEELSTQASTQESEEFIKLLNTLADSRGAATRNLKIVLSVRSDYEYEFERALSNWRESKKTVPDLMESAIREIITEPAYLAGLEYRPVYLVDNIIRDVMQSNGTLPLLSYALEQMYIEYEKSGANDGYLTEDHYNAIGGVVDGLRLRASKLYTSSDADTQRTIKNVMLRMVSLSINEKASKRILAEDLVYENAVENERVQKVLNELVNTRLIVSGPDENGQIYYEPAHDSLIRSWNLIGDWIKQYGKNLLYLQQDLSEAVKQFKANQKKLWHDDPRLNTLVNILKSSDNWLNMAETTFVKKSVQRRNELEDRKTRRQQELIEERDKVIEYEKKQKELLEEKLGKQVTIAKLNAEKQAVLREKLQEATAKTRLQKERTWLMSIGLFLLLVAAFYAFSQYRKANINVDQLKISLARIETLRKKDSLSGIELKLLNEQLDAKAQLANNKAMEATRASQKADSAAKEEKKARIELEQQRKLLLYKQTALLASRDSLNEYSRSLKFFSDSLASQLAIIQSKDRQILSARQTATYLTRSRSLLRSDPAMAYQLALESLKYDSTNQALASYVRDTLNKRNGFYESFIVDTVLSAFFSNDGKYVIVLKKDNTLALLDLGAHTRRKIPVDGKIISAEFSPIDNSLLIATKNSILRFNNQGTLLQTVERSNVLKAVFTAKGRIIEVTDNHIHIWKSRDEPVTTIASRGNTEDTEVSSNDTLLYVRKNDVVEAYDLTSGRLFKQYREPNSFLSKGGTGFIAVNNNDLLIARSKGHIVMQERYSIPLEKGYSKISLVSIADNLNTYLVMSEPTQQQQIQQQQQQQQQQISKNYTRPVLITPPELYLFIPSRPPRKLGNDIPDSRQLVLSENGNYLITGESGALSVYNINGVRLERFGGYTNYSSWAFNPVNTEIILSMSSSKLKLWIKGTPDNLSAEGKLKKFSPEELKATEEVALRYY